MDQSFQHSPQNEILNSVIDRLTRNPFVADIVGINIADISSLPRLFGLILGRVAQDNETISNITKRVFTEHSTILDCSIRDINETARRNF
jgi:hypothetical protein